MAKLSQNQGKDTAASVTAPAPARNSGGSSSMVHYNSFKLKKFTTSVVTNPTVKQSGGGDGARISKPSSHRDLLDRQHTSSVLTSSQRQDIFGRSVPKSILKNRNTELGSSKLTPRSYRDPQNRPLYGPPPSKVASTVEQP